MIERVPPEHIDWTPKAGTFTFGDVIRHIAAIERYMFAENACGRWSCYPGHDRSLADGYDATLRFFRSCHAETIGMLQSLTPEDLQKTSVTPAGTELATWKWLRAMVEHEIHHRGQMYLMLNLCDVERPRLYGLTSEEVLARSRNAAERKPHES